MVCGSPYREPRYDPKSKNLQEKEVFMNIGIIGTGNMGRVLGTGWSAAGHEVFFGSRDQRKATAIAADCRSAKAGSFAEAAAFGEVILYTVRDVLPSTLLGSVEALTDKVVIDCNNSDQAADFHFEPPVPSLAERLAADIPQARVVKAFNTVPHLVIELGREQLKAFKVSVFVCSDDAEAKNLVMSLAEDLGFVGIDSGELVRAQLVESVADFIRFQIGGMNLGFTSTISVQVIPRA